MHMKIQNKCVKFVQTFNTIKAMPRCVELGVDSGCRCVSACEGLAGSEHGEGTWGQRVPGTPLLPRGGKGAGGQPRQASPCFPPLVPRATT